MEQAMPCDVNVEAALLSNIFMKNDIIADAISVLRPIDFYYKPHEIIYTYLVKLYAKNVPLEISTFANSVGKDILGSIGGVTYLSKIIGSEATTANYKSYIQMIKTFSDKRVIIKNCSEAIRLAYEKEIPPKEIIDKVENSFMSLNELQEEKTVNAFELMESTINLIDERIKKGGALPGIPTGYKSLDNATGGFAKQDLYILAARPSMGKTAFVVNILNNIPKQYKSMLCELEMSKEKLGVRLLAPKMFKSSQALARGQLNDKELTLMLTKSSEISNKNNIFINCKSGLSLSEIRAEAKKIKIKFGLDVLFVDHIGLIRPENLKATRNDQIGQISAGLKKMAKDLDIAVVALSQLSRACEARANKRPQLSDLRESGNIEQDADTVLFLYRDDYYAERECRDSEKAGILEVMAAKNRDGDIGIMELSYNTEYQIITEKPMGG